MNKNLKYFLLNITTFITIILIVCITSLISYKVVFNQHNILEILRETGYVDNVTNNISNRLDNYVSRGLYHSIIKRDQINNDIVTITSRFFNHFEKIDINSIKENNRELFYDNIRLYLENEGLESDDESVEQLAILLSDIYINNVFPVTELSRLESTYESFDKLSSIIMVACILLLISIILTMNMLTSRSKVTYINRALMSSMIILIIGKSVLNVSNLYYLNPYTSLAIKELVNQFMTINMIVVALQIIIVIILYIIYIRVKLKQDSKKYLYKN